MDQTAPALPEGAGRFPPTRYQGSKRKLLPFLHEVLARLPGDRVLDGFGGTAAVSYLMRLQGRQVLYNDRLRANALLAEALLQPPGPELPAAALQELLGERPGRDYDDLIEREYDAIYFTAEENRAFDRLAQNLEGLEPASHRAQAWFAIAQTALIKRPYNLFHRANLGLRLASVRRSFGNKVTWERPISELLERFRGQAQRARVPGPRARVRCGDLMTLEGDFDLVYLDPPYVPARGRGTRYGDFYHFLEGMLDYGGWGQRIERGRKHRPYRVAESSWTAPGQIARLLEAALRRFSEARFLVVSYRSDGLPGPEAIAGMLQNIKGRAQIFDAGRYQYALSRNAKSRELLFVGG